MVRVARCKSCVLFVVCVSCCVIVLRAVCRKQCGVRCVLFVGCCLLLVDCCLVCVA